MNTENSQLENGETGIPASQRPDGTWRKARRVKDGYVPQEEVPLYESKGKHRSSKPQSITLPSGETANQTIPGLFIIADKGKSKKKKNKTKNVAEVTKQIEEVKIKDSPSKTTKASTTTPKVAKAPKTPKTPKPAANPTPKVEKVKPVDTKPAVDVDPVKRLRNLKKRLREIEELQMKLDKGLIAKPDSDQLAKVQRKNELLLQINELEKMV